MRAALRAVSLTAVAIAAMHGAGAADARYDFSVVARGLPRPVGIAVEGSETVYFTVVPQPGIGGGSNGVGKLDLETGAITMLHVGEPDPTSIAVTPEGDLCIAVGRRGRVYFTEVPSPGVGGADNRVVVTDGVKKMILSQGEPEPVDVAVARSGNLYWTCKAAGVILQRVGGVTSLLAEGLNHPMGLAIDHKGETLYFTEVPTPGVPGSAGGSNRVMALDLGGGGLRVVHAGDPEPTDVAVARNGNVYWTCTSAGVIVEARRRGGRR